MKLIRLSPSKVESFRLFYEEAYNGMITQEVIAQRLRGEPFEDNYKTVMGSAFHDMIENGEKNFQFGELGWTWEGSDVFVPTFCDYSMRSAKEWRDQHSDAAYEVWMTDKYVIATGQDVYNVEVVLRVDVVDPLRVFDHKTKIGTPDSYLDRWDSLQWKMYAAAFPEASEFIYVNWLFNQKKIRGGDPIYEYSLKTPEQYGRYQREYVIKVTGRERDEVEGWIGHVIRFAERKGIIQDMEVEEFTKVS